MLVIILVIVAVLALVVWGSLPFLRKSQSLSVKSIENPSGDLYLIHFTKPNNLTWRPGSFAKFTLPDVKEHAQRSRWLTIASNSNDNEVLLLTHNSDSLYKKTLTNLSVGSKVEISWLESHLSVKGSKEPIICFASDVGIAALRPIVKGLIGEPTVILNHLTKEVRVFDREMAELANQQRNFTYKTSDSLSHSQENLKNLADKYGNKATYLLSGQPDDVDTIKTVLENKGIEGNQLRIDKFDGLR